MHRGARTWTLGLAVAALVAGCGGGGGPATIDFHSPAVSKGVIKPSVHCGWGALWLPLEWGAVPADTRELAVYIARFKYERQGGRARPSVGYADLIYHIKPSLHRNPANELPPDATWSAVGGRTCPEPWGNQQVVQVLFALDRTRYRPLNMTLATKLTEEALRASKDSKTISGPRVPLIEDAAGLGWFVGRYAD